MELTRKDLEEVWGKIELENLTEIYDGELEEVAHALFLSEMNYNNCDVTKQYNYSEVDIWTALEQ